MVEIPADLETVLKDAHLPALMTALVHMTGDPQWLREAWKPTYNPAMRTDTGIPAETQAEIRREAATAIRAHLEGKPMVLPNPDTDLLRRQMNFVAGAEIPETYVDFLLDELALAGKSSKDPQFEQPKLQAAARKLKVLVIGAGMSGLLTGIRLTQAGVPFEIVEKNPGLSGRQLEPHVQLLLRAEPRLAAALLAAARIAEILPWDRGEI